MGQILKTIFQVITAISMLIALLSGSVNLINIVFLNPDIKCNYSRCQRPELVIYTGELKNKGKSHATDLILTGKFSSKIYDFTVNFNDAFIKKKTNNEREISLSLSRLPSDDICTFYIIFTDKGCEVTKPLMLRWGDRGNAKLAITECDEKIQRGIDIGSNLNKMVYKERQRIIKKNDNVLKRRQNVIRRNET